MRTIKKLTMLVLLPIFLTGVVFANASAQSSQPITWGPAGIAPQSAAEAAQVLGIDAQDAVYLTEINPSPGDPTVIGWVLGTASSGDAGLQLEARTIPMGVCSDYDPGVTQLTASHQPGWPINFLTTWQRTLLASAGHWTGLKVTTYWTECGNEAPGLVAQPASPPPAVDSANQPAPLGTPQAVQPTVVAPQPVAPSPNPAFQPPSG